MKKQIFPRIISCVLAAIMLFGMMSVMSVSAQESVSTDDMEIGYQSKSEDVVISPAESDEEEKIRIYFVNNYKWSSVYVWYWAENEGEAEKFGARMLHYDKQGEQPQYDVYYFDLPAEVIRMSFSNGDDANTDVVTGMNNGSGYCIDYLNYDTELYMVMSCPVTITEPETDYTEFETESIEATQSEGLPEHGIGAGSEVITDAQAGDKVRYTVEFSAQLLFENFEATLTYDSTKLKLVGLFDENGEELTDMYDVGSAFCPELGNPFANATTDGIIRLFDVNVNGNDFRTGKVLVTVEFVVLDTAYSEIDLTIHEMTILGGEADYFTDSEAVITDGVSLTESIEITEENHTPTQPEEMNVYSVVFVDYDGKFIDVQIVKEGESAVAPETPSRNGYNFSGWDTEFENVTSNLVVKATYTKIPKPPVQSPTTGFIKIEIAGGRGFSISIGGGTFRAQGASYMNSKAIIGEVVTVKVNEVPGTTFAGWVDPSTGTIVSSDFTYTFTASGNDFYKAMYVLKVEGVQMVTFKNDKVNRILESQYYAENDSIQFPADPTQVGFDFAGWSMTEEEIKSAIAAGEDVTVVAQWTRQIIPVNVTVNGGTGTGSYNANSAVTAVADEAPEGQKFAYWTDSKGNIKSYSESYKFYPSEDTEITAVFVNEDVVVDYQILVGIDSIDTTTIEDKNVFYFSWYCPEEYTFVKSGILAVNKDNYNAETFVAGTTDGNVYDRSPSGTNKAINSVTWTKSSVTSGQTWMACAYVQYRDASGQIITVYSELVEATKE